MMSGAPWDQTVFVAMPFGKKPVGDVEIDFNTVYQQIQTRDRSRSPAELMKGFV